MIGREMGPGLKRKVVLSLPGGAVRCSFLVFHRPSPACVLGHRHRAEHASLSCLLHDAGTGCTWRRCRGYGEGASCLLVASRDMRRPKNKQARPRPRRSSGVSAFPRKRGEQVRPDVSICPLIHTCLSLSWHCHNGLPSFPNCYPKTPRLRFV